jgi:predicted transcriptional regulator
LSLPPYCHPGNNPEVDELTKKVIRSFALWRKETLDLHELFEAGGNDPQARTAVFDIVERLVREGILQEEGNDFYSLTEKGKTLAKS